MYLVIAVYVTEASLGLWFFLETGLCFVPSHGEKEVDLSFYLESKADLISTPKLYMCHKFNGINKLTNMAKEAQIRHMCKSRQQQNCKELTKGCPSHLTHLHDCYT